MKEIEFKTGGQPIRLDDLARLASIDIDNGLASFGWTIKHYNTGMPGDRTGKKVCLFGAELYSITGTPNDYVLSVDLTNERMSEYAFVQDWGIVTIPEQLLGTENYGTVEAFRNACKVYVRKVSTPNGSVQFKDLSTKQVWYDRELRILIPDLATANDYLVCDLNDITEYDTIGNATLINADFERSQYSDDIYISKQDAGGLIWKEVALPAWNMNSGGTAQILIANGPNTSGRTYISIPDFYKIRYIRAWIIQDDGWGVLNMYPLDGSDFSSSDSNVGGTYQVFNSTTLALIRHHDGYFSQSDKFMLTNKSRGTLCIGYQKN